MPGLSDQIQFFDCLTDSTEFSSNVMALSRSDCSHNQSQNPKLEDDNFHIHEVHKLEHQRPRHENLGSENSKFIFVQNDNHMERKIMNIVLVSVCNFPVSLRERSFLPLGPQPALCPGFLSESNTS